MGHYRSISENRGGLGLGWEVYGEKGIGEAFRSHPIYLTTLAACQGLLSAAPLLLAGLAVSFWKNRGQRARVGLLAAAGLAFYATCAHRWATLNLVWALPAGVAAAAWLVHGGLGAERRWVRRTAAGTLAVASLAVGLFTLDNLYTLVAERSYTVRGPGGALRTLDPMEAASLQETLNAIEREVPRGEPLFCYGYVPLVNFLALRPSPTRYQFFLYPVYHTYDQYQEVLASLERRSKAYILLPMPLMPENAFHAWTKQNCRRLWGSPRMALYVREPEGGDRGRP